MNRFLLLLLLGIPGLGFSAPESLFDGKSLDGWETKTPERWRAEDGSIVSGDLKEKIPNNFFLFTKKEYGDFEFRCQFRLTGDPATGLINSGIQFRSVHLPNGHASGYQADIGDAEWWGCIYDEHRRNKVIAKSDMAVVGPAVKRGDWNEYVIRCEGPRSRLWINGVPTVDFVEKDPKIARSGKIAVQVHSGGAAKVEFKDLTIEEFERKESPLTPEEQLGTFVVPEGFEVELVASEETGLSKPITVSFDDAGRMWSMTATEYPVDGNETPDQAMALWKNGGKDRVVVFDDPLKKGPHTARTFADGLAMPMGILPWKDGAIVGQGPEIVFLGDADGDGKADSRTTLVKGFGVQDSHLMPHQFTMMPGGWIAMAQGAFNRSKVVADENPPVSFDYCKMGRFRPDGSEFEVVGYGLNNIWGLVLGREGEVFIQEANDMHYSVVPFQVGSSYPGIGNQKFKPYAPFAPPVANFRMGGTGLSGLALSDSVSGTFPDPWKDVMFVANPITCMINAVKVTGVEGGGYAMERLPDFLTSSDLWFRPIAMTFGPDGCLYIVDWYNKIISHNEVPRKHPDRDKTRGRVWRVRHVSQKNREVPNIAAMADEALVGQLKSDSTWAMRAAWRQIVFREAKGLAPELVALAKDENTRADSRIHALWALEGIGMADAGLVGVLGKSGNRNIRREAAAIFADAEHADDPDPQVRAQAIRTIARKYGDGAIGALIAFAKPMLEVDSDGKTVPWGGKLGKPVPSGPGYDREFERYLVRAALERNPEKLAAFLDGPEAEGLPAENLLFASLALPGDEATGRFVRAWKRIQRAPSDEELLLLLKGNSDPKLRPIVAGLFADPDKATPLLRATLRLRDRLGKADLSGLLTPALGAVSDGQLLVDVAAAFRLGEAKGLLLERVKKAGDAAEKAGLIAALGRVGGGGDPAIVSIAKDEDALAPVRGAALSVLGSSEAEGASDIVGTGLGSLPEHLRASVLSDLSGSVAGSRVIIDCLAAERIALADLTPDMLDRMRTLLPDDARMDGVWDVAASSFPKALRLGGKGGQFSATEIVAEGPFTVETWIRLDKGIGNEDGILGNPGGMDLNFFGGQFRVYAGKVIGDVAVAKKAMAPGAWTHLAAVRNKAGVFKIYINGELDAVGNKAAPGKFENLNIGQTTPSDKGTSGEMMEFRFWKAARSAEEIRDHFNRTFAGGNMPAELVHYFPNGGDPGDLVGGAEIVRLAEAPKLLSEAEAKAEAERLAKFKGVVSNTKANPKEGAALFVGMCLSCHTVGGKGGGAAPPLDGSGHRDLDSLLRAILTPDAAVEAGYRAFRVETHDGRLMEGYLYKQDGDGVTLKLMGGAEMHFPAGEIKRAGFTNRSFMIPGLLDGLSEQQVADLIAHIGTIKEEAPAKPKREAALEKEGRQVSESGIRHSFLMTGPRTVLVGEDNSVLWETKEKSRDGYVLPSGNILVAHAKVVREYEREGGVAWEYNLSPENGEISTALRLESGDTMVVELGKNPRVLEIAPDGKIVSETPLQPETDNVHMQTRMARKLPNGNYLVPHLLAFAVKEYNPAGEVVSTIKTDLEELGGREAENWPFTAIRLPNGNTLVNLTHGNKTVEFTPEGKVAWKVDNSDLGGRFADPCGGQRLPNGNTIICSYGQRDAKKVRVFEVTPEKEVVWEYFSPVASAHEIHVLRTNGEAVDGALLK